MKINRFNNFSEGALNEANLPQKGLPAYVYRSPLGDSTAGGITGKFERVIIVGEDIPQVFPVTDKAPAVYLDTIKAGRESIHAKPVDQRREKSGTWMFGGNFIYSSDSRFSKLNNGYPIPVHDRFEDWATYNAMSR